MTRQNIYLTYKKDTSRLLYWIINTSNGLLQSGRNTDDIPVTINTTGRITVAEMIHMSTFIGKHFEPIPSTILTLLEAVIEARSTVYAAFQQIMNAKPDPFIKSSSANHEYFIDALTEAFEALGGNSRNLGKVSDEEQLDADDIFLNQFSVLSLGGAKNDEGDASSEDDAPSMQRRPQKKKTGNGKKGKRSKRAKRRLGLDSTKEPRLANVPIESYVIIEEKDGNRSDYLLAVYAVEVYPQAQLASAAARRAFGLSGYRCSWVD